MAAVFSPNEWPAKLSAIPRSSTGSATLELTTDIPTASFLDFLTAARADFDAIDIARGKNVLRLSGAPPVPDREELLLTLRTDAFFVEVSGAAPVPEMHRQSDVVEHVGDQLQSFLTSTWRGAPCELTVLANEDVPLFTVVDAVIGVSMARPCVSSFSFGWAHAPREPRHAPLPSGRVLTLRVPVPPASAPPQPTVHEERDVRVGNVVENWRIQWRHEPAVACFGWSCSCSQFMFGRRGQADLIRSRPGVLDDVFPLEELFDGHFGLDLPTHGLNEAILRTWSTQAGDETGDGVDEAVVRARPRVTVMDLHDYDRDGRATEFVLPVGGAGCAFHHYVAVGISRSMPWLHVLGTAAHPAVPLELSWAGWDLLQKSRGGTYVDVECGFRGADEQLEITLRADAAGIHENWVRYACPRADGRVIEKRAF
ncbi:MAG TPA: hypothetical protein VHC69_22065 [Polyangiaceae bacterium]|nr:hypothetical protein [Polyangiaceae bacterium]